MTELRVDQLTGLPPALVIRLSGGGGPPPLALAYAMR
jgi:hypothetical protein